MQQRVYERAKALMEAELGDELVALDPAGGECFGFNPVAYAVWRLLERPSTARQLKQSLLLEYDVDPDKCEAELSNLLDDLVGRGLVRVRADGE
jgi:hypothetical protein